MSVPFFESIVNEFSQESWEAGLSIYRAGGVQNFESFGELSQAEVRAGMGERFKIHVKFHSDGRCIQWMDCSCRDNRRRGLKCAHLAAFCLYVDLEEPQFLDRLRLSGGTAEALLLGTAFEDSLSPGAVREDPESGPSAGGVAHHASAQDKSSQGRKLTMSGFHESEHSQATHPQSEMRLQSGALFSQDSLKKLAHARDPGGLTATVSQPNGREIKYHLGVDDSVALLSWPGSSGTLTERLESEWSEALVARRFFLISRSKKGVFSVMKSVEILRQEERLAVLPWQKIAPAHLGRTGLFIRKFGFVPFEKAFEGAREARWQDYPSCAVLESDVVASLFDGDFSMLKTTAPVVLDDQISHLSVSTGVRVSELEVSEDRGGSLLVGASFSKSEGPEKGDVQLGISLYEVLQARSQGKEYIETDSGWVRVGEEFDWVAGKVDPKGQMHLSKLEFIRFRETLAADSRISGQGNVARRLCSGLVSQAQTQAPSLEQSKLNLRPYQVEGYAWLWWLYENHLGGLLADEMGLGKTHQAMALLYGTQAQSLSARPSLVVCPTSVIDHWLEKLRVFVPECDVISYYGSSRRLFQGGGPGQVYVTSYGVLLRDVDLLAEQTWSVVVLDEAHLVKNQTTRTYQAACQIPSQMRLCLTGTPLENDLLELKTLFDYIVPGYLGDDAAFKKRYLQTTSAENPLMSLELKRLVHPFKLRRAKSDVLADLPEKVEDTRYCQLSPQQKALYDQALQLKASSIVDSLQGESGGAAVPYVHVFAVITLLKQICDDPGLIHDEYDGMESGKLELLDEILGEALESNQKVVIFSQYARMVRRLSERLHRSSIRHVCLTGQSTNRGKIVAEFQENPEVKVFVGSLLAGGTGIDLTAANVVIHFDRWWNAAKEDQATDRIHRIGQQKNVQVFKLVTRGTLEEHIDLIIKRKKETFARFVEEDLENFKNLSRDDILTMLAPARLPDADTDPEAAARSSATVPDLRQRLADGESSSAPVEQQKFD